MKLADVIESLVEERGLDRDKVTEIVCEGIRLAYEKKFPLVIFEVHFSKKTGELDIFARKRVVTSAIDADKEISVRQARMVAPAASLDEEISVPFTESIGRIEILAAKQIIAGKIRGLEQLAVYSEFKDRQGDIVSGVIHKRERSDWVVKIGDVLALLPKENTIEGEAFKIGYPVRMLLKEVLPVARGDYQLILDRASTDFVKKLIELEIPEVFEGIVEIKKIVRKAGYKSKLIVASSSREIDPVGTCVGVGGARIKPILREIGQEKIDLIEESESLEQLVRDSLKPAQIDNVEVFEEDEKAVVWLAQDQRSLAIGKMGQNIQLASKLVELEIQLQSQSEASADFYRNEMAEELSENQRNANKRDKDSDEILEDN